ncbi:ATP-binding cassette domain-containing protein [Pseudonocardia sp. HH130630-07]|uniref:ATP-binding cassette domain-containing protein n=1 Tax=Pseudonocardia sp. HH130630-07 TaxID=1690815 RepID=UPI000839D07F|nr:ABC transporter ATP-binding protein [Pseudonocardia sp. HH130630-07]
MAEAPVLDIRGLTVRYGAGAVVDDVGLTVGAGEVVGLIGESGSGKTSVALACLGLLPDGADATADRFAVAGHDLVGLRERELRRIRGRRIAMIFQEPMSALNPCLSVGAQLAEAVRHEGLRPRAARARAVELLDRVRIPEPDRRVRQYPHQLSGGQRQRVVIAMAVAARPDVLVADEPTTALDVTVQADILDLLAELRTEFGMGILFVSHDLGVIARISTRVLVMHRGRIVETGATTDVLTAPRQPYTRWLLASVPRPDTPARTPLPVGGPAGTDR